MYSSNPWKIISFFLFIFLFSYSLNSFSAQNKSTKTTTTSVTKSSQQHDDDLNLITHDDEGDEDQEEEDEFVEQPLDELRINKIFVTGNKLVPAEAILDRIPFRPGELYDASKTRRVITSLYHDLRRFKNISIYGERIGAGLINLYVAVDEKPMLKEVVFEKNTQVAEKEIREKIDFSTIPALDDAELKRYAFAILKIYKDKGYHLTEIQPELIVDAQGKATAKFIFTEHKKSVVRRVDFIGNANISSKKLRGVIFTREDWLLSFLDKSGTYQQERIDADKHMIEQFYQNNGYLNAKVIDVIVDIDPKSNLVKIAYEIEEGFQYKVNTVTASGNDILKDEFLVSMVPIRPGDIYSRENIVNAIKSLEFIWGDLGYVYTHIEPSIQPDEETHTVNISFFSDIGSRVFLNKLTVKGNSKTRDKIIRRTVSLEEGGLITNRQMDSSKNRVEALGYFDQRDGVNWKMTRLDENTADLDLMLKEAKTGSAHLKIGFGGSAQSIQSAAKSVTLEGDISDTNLFGSGIRVNLNGKFGLEEQTILFNLTQPWLFDKPLYGSMDIYHKRVSYDEFVLTRPVNEKHSGGQLTTGFVCGPWHRIVSDMYVRFGLAINDIRYEARSNSQPNKTKPVSSFNLPDPVKQTLARAAYDIILANEFDPGMFLAFTTQIGRDTRNHPMHPTRGYVWYARSLITAPALNSNIGFHRFDIDVNWFTPLIGDFDLILRLHGFVGMINRFGNHLVPYRELFHIGGPASVRGFLYGQIGPQFCVDSSSNPETRACDSIGATKTAFFNAELIMPVTNDFSVKAVLFYDGGAGWDNPYAKCVDNCFIKNNHFDYRHAVGVGVRLLNPMPMRVDWGFKLDPRKGESGYEVHFGMTYDW